MQKGPNHTIFSQISNIFTIGPIPLLKPQSQVNKTNFETILLIFFIPTIQHLDLALSIAMLEFSFGLSSPAL